MSWNVIGPLHCAQNGGNVVKTEWDIASQPFWWTLARQGNNNGLGLDGLELGAFYCNKYEFVLILKDNSFDN